MAEMSDISESMVKVDLPEGHEEQAEHEQAHTSVEEVNIPEQATEQEICTERPDEIIATSEDNAALDTEDADDDAHVVAATEIEENQSPLTAASVQDVVSPGVEACPIETEPAEDISESVHIEDACEDHYGNSDAEDKTVEAAAEVVANSPVVTTTTQPEEKTNSPSSADEDSVSSEGESDHFVMVKKDEVPSVEDLPLEAVKEAEEPEHEKECHLVKGDGDGEKKEEDEWLLVLGHEKLKKKVLRRGKGVDTRPIHGNTVTVHSGATLPNGKKVDQTDSLTFVLGDGDVIQALDLCVGLMELGEVAEIVTEAQYAYGSLGRQSDIPGDVVLTYEVEVLSTVMSPVHKELPIAERVRLADEKRERGNFLYTRQEHAASINSYTKALKILDDSGENHHGVDTAAIQSLIDTRVKCYNNLAAAQIKLEVWDVALKSCDETLKVQPENVKALFRKGKCLEGKGETDAAIACFKRAIKLDPESKVIHQELSRLTNRQKAQQKSERELYQKMLGTQDKPVTKKDQPEDDEESVWWKYGVAGAVVLGAAAVGAAFYKSST